MIDSIVEPMTRAFARTAAHQDGMQIGNREARVEHREGLAG